jgi:flagellar M-ring protein FliF
MENVPVPTNPAAQVPLPTTPLAVMQSNVSSQPIMKQLGFLLAIAASIAIGGYVFMWSMSPNYQVLFSGMEPKEASEVVSILQSSGVKYKLDPGTGQLLVPGAKVQSLRLKLAAEGLPRSASPGMDILNEDQGFGTSQFVERARYQKALEEELARSIVGIQNVRSARVHLATPKQSVFVRDRKAPTASVVVNLYAGRALEQGQVAAITHMVASSVPNMASTNVNVVDQRGNLLTQPERDKGISMSNNQFQYTQKLEKLYISRIEDILSPIVGVGGVRAQVVAEVDFTVTEQTHESYNPDMAVLRSEQLQEENRMGGREAFGVPGALSNQPPRAAGTRVEENLVDNDREGESVSTDVQVEIPSNNSKSLTRNFEIDRTISHTRVAPGSVRKLSVAVLVDEHRSVDDSGNTVSTPLTESEMTRINALVMDAIGFSKARGDTLNIVNAPFMVPDSVEALPEIPVWQQPWVWDVVKQGLGGLVILFLILGVIRPAFKDLNKVSATSAQAMAAAGVPAEQAAATAAVDMSKNGQEMEALMTGAGNLEGQLNDVRSLVQQDPALVAQVVKNWAASE